MPKGYDWIAVISIIISVAALIFSYTSFNTSNELENKIFSYQQDRDKADIYASKFSNCPPQLTSGAYSPYFLSFDLINLGDSLTKTTVTMTGYGVKVAFRACSSTSQSSTFDSAASYSYTIPPSVTGSYCFDLLLNVSSTAPTQLVSFKAVVSCDKDCKTDSFTLLSCIYSRNESRPYGGSVESYYLVQ